MAGRAVENGHEEAPGASTSTAVVQVAVGEAHSVALTANGSVYTWGRGQFGRMGMGVFQDELVPTLVEIMPMGMELDESGSESPATRESDCERSRITQLVAGAYHCLALSGDGTVWSWGFNAYGQLGREGAAAFPAPISVFRSSSFSLEKNRRDSQNNDSSTTKVAVVEAGGMMSSAIDKDGGLWLWGAVPEPSAGVQITDSDSYHKSDVFQLASIEKPSRVLALRDRRVLRVACGNEHILALLEGRHGNAMECYAWGGNAHGQLGLGDLEARDMPTLVTAVPAAPSATVMDFACGAFHSVVITTTVGEEDTESDSSSMKWQGSGHLMDDQVMASPKLRERVTPEESRSREYPYNIRNQSSYGSSRSSGRAYSQSSSGGRALVTPRFSTCWTFGQGQNGQLGHGTCVSSHTPAAVEALPTRERILTAVCGMFHTAVVMESGDVWVWGMEGGLGMCPGIGPPGSKSGDALTPVRVFGESSATCHPVTGAKGIACGVAHTVTVSNGGADLWAWGRGKNGVLGLGHHSDSWFPSPVVWPPGSQFRDSADAEAIMYPDLRKSSSRASSRGGGSRGRGDEIRPYVRDVEDSKPPRSSSYGRLPAEQYVDDRSPRAGCGSFRKGLSESPGGPSRHQSSAAGYPSRLATGGDDSPGRSLLRAGGMQSPSRPSRRVDPSWAPVTPEPEVPPRNPSGGGALQSEDVASLKSELTECRRYAERLHTAVYGGVKSFALPLQRNSAYHDPKFNARKTMPPQGYDAGSAAAALQVWQQHVEEAPLEELAKLELFYKGMRNRLKEVLFHRRMEDWCRRTMLGMAESPSSFREPPPARDPYSAQSTPYYEGPGELGLRMSGIPSDRGEIPPPAALAASLAELRMHFQRRR